MECHPHGDRSARVRGVAAPAGASTGEADRLLSRSSAVRRHQQLDRADQGDRAPLQADAVEQQAGTGMAHHRPAAHDRRRHNGGQLRALLQVLDGQNKGRRPPGRRPLQFILNF